jgi:Ca-activated chloride channel family protein
MQGRKLTNAVDGTINFLNQLEQDDEVIIYSFNYDTERLQPSGRVGDVVESLRQSLRGLHAGDSTRLYDSVCMAVDLAKDMQMADEARGDKRLYGIVVLSDGRDTASSLNSSGMFKCLPSGEDVEGIKIFTIAYGNNANEAILQRISDQTNGKYYVGDPDTIEEVYLAISYEQ